MPGRRLLAMASAWFDEATVSRVFEPLIADWQREHVTLSGVGRARSVLRVCGCFATTFVLSLPWQLKRALPERMVLSGWIATEAFAAAGVIALIYLFYGFDGPAAGYLLPAALGMALPLAIVPAAVIVSRIGGPVETRTMVLRLALMVMVVLVPLLAWIMPATNQTWRVVQRPVHEVVLRGPREITLPELLSSRPPTGLVDRYAHEWDRTRSNALLERSSVLLMPLTMSLLGIAISRSAGRGWIVRAGIGWAIAGVIWLTLNDVSSPMAHPVLLSVAALFHWHSRRRAIQDPVAA